MDIKDKDRLIAKLRESEDRYRSVTETSIDAIITADASDSILTWNKGAKLIFGYDSEIIGNPVTTIIPEKYRNAHLNGIRRFLKTGEKNLIGKTKELEAIREDGKVFPIELSLSAWDSPSGVNFGAIIRDISERKNFEWIRENVFRMMRHDLKSPLIGITGLSKVVQKGAYLTDQQRKAAALIQELGERTLKFIARNQDLLQIEQGVYKLKPKPVKIFELLNRIKTELEPLTLKQGIKFDISPPFQCSEKKSEYIIRGEEDLLEVMFANLIKNAIEASPEGSSVKISVNDDEKGGRNYHLFDIFNFGNVPLEIRDKFFAPYATSKRKGGTGLGTYSALLIAKAHQGDIQFTTSEKEGTHVIVLLPKMLFSDNSPSPQRIDSN